MTELRRGRAETADLHNPDGSHRTVADFPAGEQETARRRLRAHQRAHVRHETPAEHRPGELVLERLGRLRAEREVVDDAIQRALLAGQEDGASISDMAATLGVSRQTIRDWISGGRKSRR